MVIFDEITIFFILQYLKYINLFTEILPFIFFVIYSNKIDSKNKRVFFIYTAAIAILVFAVVITRYYFSSYASYYLVIRLYNVVEYALLAYLFYLYIKNKIVRLILLYSIIPYTLFCIFDFVKSEGSTLAFLPLIIEYLVLLLFIIYFFFEVMQENVVEPIYKKAIFWISVAFIINFSGNFFLLLSSISSYTNTSFFDAFIIINGTITILKNILLCVAVTLKEEKGNDGLFSDLSIDSKLDSSLPFKNPN